VYAGHVDKLDNELLRTHALQLLDLLARSPKTVSEVGDIAATTGVFAHMMGRRSEHLACTYHSIACSLDSDYCCMSTLGYVALSELEADRFAIELAELREMVIRD
jgi:hypothetical protein